MGSDLAITLTHQQFSSLAERDARGDARGDAGQTVILNLHRILLTSCSPYFSTLLASGFREAATAEAEGGFEMKDIPAHVMILVVEFIYSGAVSEGRLNDVTSVYEVLEAADLLFLPRLKAICGAALASHVTGDDNREDAETVLDAIDVALRFQLDRLEDHCTTMMARCLDSLLEEPLRQRFADLVTASAWSIQARESTDSIPIVDAIRAALNDTYGRPLHSDDTDPLITELGSEGDPYPDVGDAGDGGSAAELRRRHKIINDLLSGLGLATVTG